MLSRLRGNLTYANVMATIAVFVALGGSSYAVGRVTGADIADGTIRARDVAPNALTGRQIAERRLGRVPRARVAAALTGRARARLRLRCPPDTRAAVGLCFERVPHRPFSYLGAIRSCAGENGGNRWLPTTSQLVSYFATGADIAPGGELTSDVFESRGVPGRTDVLVLVSELGQTTVAPAVPLDGQGGGTVRMPFRCVTTPTNVP